MCTTLFPLHGPMETSEFAMSFTSTLRGTRLARLLVVTAPTDDRGVRGRRSGPDKRVRASLRTDRRPTEATVADR